VQHQLLEVGVGEVTALERGQRVSLGLRLEDGRAAQGDDPAVPAGEHRAGPDLAVEEVQVAKAAEHRVAARRLGVNKKTQINK
jgi:hypothetical protein